MFSNLLKAAVGVVIETPIAIAADIVTLGGAINDKRKPYTVEAVEKIVGNVQAATKDSGNE